MDRTTTNWITLGLLACGVATAHAAEPPPATASSSSQAASAAAPMQMLTAQGTVSALDLKATPATLSVTAADGKILAVILDPMATQVWENNAKGSLEQLKLGQWVKVRYAAQHGKETAKSIQIGHAPAAAQPASKTY